MTRSRTLPLVAAASAVAAALAAAPAPAATAPVAASAPAAAAPGPARIVLPRGFQPEGIAVDRERGRAFFGSLADGSIYRANLRTGEGRRLRPGPGVPSVGLKYQASRNRLYVAGGPSGEARVVSARTGRIVKRYRLATSGTFVNDVVLTRRAAWFTDSQRAVLYRLPIRRDGSLPPASAVRRLPLRGAWTQPTGADAFGANGIETTPRGAALLVVNSAEGRLYRVDRRSGRATRVRLGGASLTNGDGLLRIGTRLFVVRNRLNRVAVLRLGRQGRTGRQVRVIPDRRFDVPTTVAVWKGSLYLPNARFGTEPTPTTRYDAVRVR